MFRGVDIAPEIFSRIFFKKCSSLSFRCNVRSLSFGPGVFATTVSMASAAVPHDRSNGVCLESTASGMVAEGNSILSSNGFLKSTFDGRADSDGNCGFSGVGGGKSSLETLLKISPQFCSSIPDNLTDPRGDFRDSGAENAENGRVEGEEGLAKRLRIEERATSDSDDFDIDRHVAGAWDHWRKLGEPKMHVAPMVDQSELPFRMLCRKYGATAAYTPMLHARLFSQDGKYRIKEFSTCKEDRPLFVQFCANNPDVLLKAARLVENDCDYVDINLGCPQRIAKKGYYGAFLMDNLPLVRSLVTTLSANLTSCKVSCKIRVFPNLEDTLAYARMLEEAGCSLLAVHGRTRDQKDGKLIRADWEAVKAVKQALRIPVLGNGNIRWVEDVHSCMAYTGVDGVMSAESLLENPALFAGYLPAHTLEDVNPEEATGEPCSDGGPKVEQPQGLKIDERILILEYLNFCEEYPVPMRMVRGHVHKILGNYWFKRNPGIRAELNKEHTLTLEWLKTMVHRLMERPPSISPLLPVTKVPTEAVSDTIFAPIELPVKAFGCGSPDVLPVLSTENAMSLS